MATVTKITCPNCGLNRSNRAFDEESESKFGTWDESKPIIQIRDAPGGKASSIGVGTGKYRKSPGKGFPAIDSFTLGEAKDMPEYSGYVDQITEQLLKVLNIFYSQGLISDEDLDSVKEL